MFRNLPSLRRHSAKSRSKSGLRKSGRRRRLRCETLQQRIVLSADAMDLSVLNDEFDDAATLAQWQLVSEAEGWQAQHFETYDINQTTPGAMTISPQTSTWYQDYQGDLSFKEVTGDFSVTTQVSVTDLDHITDSDDDDIPNGGSFSLGGVMLRTPRDISDGPNEWTPGGANFVFLSLGHGYDGTMSFESKTTVDSVSTVELISAQQATAVLRIVREGAAITTLYRYDSDSDWQIAGEFERSDMPETLQVGLLGYSDYGKTSTFDAAYFNNHTLIDTPENAAASSNASIPYSPDLQASFEYVRFERLGVEQPTDLIVEVPVVNSGFEDVSAGNPNSEFTFGAPSGWELYDPNQIASSGSGPAFYIGTLRPGEVASQPGVVQYFSGGAPEGSRVGLAFNVAGSGGAGEYGMQQTLAASLASDTTYSLSVDIGNIATGVSTNGSEFLLDGFPGYQIALLAGDEIIALDDNTLAGSIPEGEFMTSTIDFTSMGDHPQTGQPLSIRLVNLNQAADVPAGHALEVDFDNVRLTMTVPAFSEIGDRTVYHDAVLDIVLAGTFPDGQTIDYTATVQNETWVDLDQSLDLRPNDYAADGSPQYYETYGDYGFKWLRSDQGGWMYLDADGSLNRWLGSAQASETVAQLNEFVYDDPSLLHEAVAGGTVVIHDAIDGHVLTIDPADGFSGEYYVQVEKSAGTQSVTEIIVVTVINEGLEIAEIADQSVAAGETLTIDLPNADSVSYEVEIVENIAADLQEEWNIVANANLVASDYGFNYLGQNERWVQSSTGWLFITPEGSVHDWNGSYEASPQLEQLDARYHADPGLLIDAEHVEVTAIVVDGQLQVSAASDFIGSIGLRLLASDGSNADEVDFVVEFQSWAGAVDGVFGQ